MTSARQRLREYISRSRLQQKEFAARVGITDSYLSQILSGVRRPSLPIAVRLEGQTGIVVASWLDTRVGRQARAAQNTRKRRSDLRAAN